MAYVEFHQALLDHRKTVVAAERLQLKEVYLAGHLAALWAWCLDNCPDGILPTSARAIARGARWDDDPQEFLDAIEEAGFVDRDGLSLSIHDWSDYGGKLIEKRRANAAKQARYRERHADDGDSNGNVTVTLRQHNPLEKSREEKSRVTPPISPSGEEQSKPVRAIKTPIPINLADLIPPDTWRAIGEEQHLTDEQLRFETSQMVDHFQSKGERRPDWVAGWRKWMRSDYRQTKPSTMQNGRYVNKGGIMKVAL